jgi:hypothetical protein
MKKRAYWIAGLVGLVLLVGVAVFFFVSDTAGEIAELAAEGGEIRLREPMRPIRGGTRVLIIGLDGVGDDKLREMVRLGLAPHIAALWGPQAGEDMYAHAYATPGTLSVLPSTTMATWTSLFTGEAPGRSGVPGNEWYERKEMRFYAPGPNAVPETEHTMQMYTDDFLGRVIGVPTLFELADVRSHVSLLPVHRGADLLTTPSLNDVVSLFGELARGLQPGESAARAPYAAMDQNSVERALGAFRDHGIPDLQVVYFPGIDLYTHVADHPLQEMERYMAEIIDPGVGRILQAYADAGVLEQTYVAFVSDHGHTPVLNDPAHALGVEPETGPAGVLAHAGFRVRPFSLELEDDEEDYQATLAYQGAIAYVYLADRSTCPGQGTRCSWTLPPRLEEDVLAAARAFDRANQFGEGGERLRHTLDLILAREPSAAGQDARPFQVWDGDRLIPIADYLAANPRPDLLDFENRMTKLSAGPFGHRAGDILLMARSGGNRPITERYYFSDLYHSWHGSAEHLDSRIPLVLARAGASGDQLRAMVQQVVGDQPSQLHLVPLVLQLLGD